MSYTYEQRKKAPGAKAAAARESAAQGPGMDALRAGLAKPSAAQMGRRVDLPEAMRAKMEASFGADLSAVKLYESRAVAEAGAEAVTRGNNIAFAPGMLDFTSHSGQALLGHELSHVVSQQRGEVTGGGFLNDRALEARADREGAMAAAGQQVYSGSAAPTASLSAASATSAAGPMQASKKEAAADKKAEKMLAISMAKNQKMDVSEEDDDFLSNSSTTYDDDVIRALMRAKAGHVKNIRDRREQDQGGKDYTLTESYDVQRMRTADKLMDGMFRKLPKAALKDKLKSFRAESFGGKTGKEVGQEAESLYSAAEQGDRDFIDKTNNDAPEAQHRQMVNDQAAEEALTKEKIADDYENLHLSWWQRRKKRKQKK